MLIFKNTGDVLFKFKVNDSNKKGENIYGIN